MKTKSLGFRGFARGSGIAAGRARTFVWACRACRAWAPMPLPSKGPPLDRCTCGALDWERFDSKAEAARFATLLLAQRAGSVRNLQRQVRFALHAHGPEAVPVPVAVYVADFTYDVVLAGVWSPVIEDCKGLLDPVAILKLKIMAAMGHLVRLTKGITR